MDDVSRYPNLLLRNDTFYHQVRVPADIAGSYGRRFERRSLRTKVLKEAAARLVAEDGRVQRLFDEHRARLQAKVSTPTLSAVTIPSAHGSIDVAEVARHHARDVVDQEYALRAASFAELTRRITSDGTAEALFRGEIVPLPASEYLDHVLSEAEIDTDVALAAIHRVRLRVRIADLKRGLLIGNFALVAEAVEQASCGAPDREQHHLARALMKAEIGALQGLLEDTGHPEHLEDAPTRHNERAEMPLGAGVTQKPGSARANPASNLAPDLGTENASPLLSLVEIDWTTEKARTNAWTVKTRHEREAAVRSFIEVCGDKPIATYRKVDVRRFKDLLFAIPPNAHKKAAFRNLCLLGVAEKAAAEGAEKPTAKTVNVKMDAVSSLFAWARQNYDEAPANPFEGVKPKIDTAPREERDPFTLEELKTIFAMPPFTGALSESHWLQRGTQTLRSSGKFWVPLIALYTGARLMEIVQLRKCDVRAEDGMTFFDINDEGESRVKTRTERRRIPVHPALLAAGLMRHVASSRHAEDRLFADIAMGSEKNRSGPASKLFARLFAAAGVKHGRNCFHSFRHTFEDACRAARIDTAVMNALQGHAERGMAGRYGSGFQHAHRLHKVINAPRADAGDPRLLGHRDQRLLHCLLRLEEAGKVAARPGLRDLQVQRPEPHLECSVAVTIAPSLALGVALEAAGADHAVHVSLHNELQHALGHKTEEVGITTLREQLGKR